MILKVARLGHPVLRQVAEAVPPGKIRTAEFQRFLDDMIETMYEYHGVGLAAPQVHVSQQVAVLEVKYPHDHKEGEDVPLTVLINPKLKVLDRNELSDWEGCLSIPDLRGQVPRFKWLEVTALDREGKRLQFVAKDFHARVVQHEFDHLQGRVYLDRMSEMKTLSFLEEHARYWSE
ncbi:MAG: peptide deformylase [Acidobacteria bacterium]|nr:peptide deformylase [Acidobacteriota bacterium]